MMKTRYKIKNILPSLISILFILVSSQLVFADIYINVMAVNGSSNAKDTPINFSLPGDLTSQDILDTNGLELDYNVNDANYYVHGKVTLQPKESKTYRIRVRDVWKLSLQQADDIKKEIEQGYDQIGKQKDPQQGQLLKDQLVQRLNFIVKEQGAKADTIEKRMDAYRAYLNELKRIENSALAVDYWQSDPSEVKQSKVIHFNIEVENPLDKPSPYKHKHYLPSEVKPEDLVEFEGFEVRYDQEKKQAFLYKEDNLQPKEKKKYTIGIKDIWFIPKKNIDYLKKRADYAYDFLKESKYAPSAKILYDHIGVLLKGIEESQAQKRDSIMEHISGFRDCQRMFDAAQSEVDSLEKLLSLYREDLEKSKVKNVLQRMQSLKSVADISKAVFNKKFEQSTSWSFISWTLLFVAFLTVVSFIVWTMRSKDKKIVTEQSDEASKENKEQPK